MTDDDRYGPDAPYDEVLDEHGDVVIGPSVDDPVPPFDFVPAA